MSTRRSHAPRPTELGNLLKRLREAASLTQEGIADAAGVSQETISAIERGATPTPQMATLHALAGVLRVDVADFVLASGLAGTRAKAVEVAARGRSCRETAPTDDATDPDVTEFAVLRASLTWEQHRQQVMHALRAMVKGMRHDEMAAAPSSAPAPAKEETPPPSVIPRRRDD